VIYKSKAGEEEKEGKGSKESKESLKFFVVFLFKNNICMGVVMIRFLDLAYSVVIEKMK
jgi:hypothetical protein